MPDSEASQLPVELVRSILEDAARESRPTALSLVLVSKAVREWITPIIYRTITTTHLGDGHNNKPVILLWKALQSQSRNMAHIRNMCFQVYGFGRFHETHLIDILSRCSQLERLVMGGWWDFPYMDTAFDHWLPKPWELTLQGANTRHVLEVIMKRSIFGSITHLYTADPVPQRMVEANIYRIFPQLTHFAFDRIPGPYGGPDPTPIPVPAFTKNMLSAYPSLKIILIHAFQSFDSHLPCTDLVGQTWVELAEIQDERLLVRPGIQVEQWDEFLASGETMWDNAKERFENWRERVKR